MASFFPQHTAKIMRLLFSIEMFPAHNRVDVSHRVFNVPHYLPNHHEGELVVSIEDCAQAIREVKRVVEKFEIPLNFVQEVKQCYSYVYMQCCFGMALNSFVFSFS